jgi:hypothetical protein
MKLSEDQLRKFGIKFVNQLREELKQDKPFGTDEWPDVVAEVSDFEYDEENLKEPPDWHDVDEVFDQLFELFESALPKKVVDK